MRGRRLKSYFDTIPHERLMALVEQRVVDGSVLALLTQSLKAGVLEELQGWQPTERGTPQGAVVTPWTHLVTSSFPPACR